MTEEGTYLEKLVALRDKLRGELEAAEQIETAAARQGLVMTEYVRNVNDFRCWLEEAEYLLARARFGAPPIDD